MNDELMIRVKALNEAFLTAQEGAPGTAERFLAMINELHAWANEAGFDEWDVHRAINAVGAQNSVFH